MEQYEAVEKILDIQQNDTKNKNGKKQYPVTTPFEKELQARLNINRTEILQEKAKKEREKNYKINIQLEKKCTEQDLNVLIKQITILALNNNVLIKHIETSENDNPPEMGKTINDQKKIFLEYSQRLLPIIKKDKHKQWSAIWQHLAESPLMENRLLQPTVKNCLFNRNGFANSVAYIKNEYPDLFIKCYSTEMAKLTEGNKEHPIRAHFSAWYKINDDEKEIINNIVKNIIKTVK